MKKLYEKNLVENLYQNTQIPYETLLEFLSGDDFEQKHFALTFITFLKNPDDITLFIQNLVDQDTKIRETASFRINDFILENNALMEILDKCPDIILRTANDVNPQVCRNICSLLNFSRNKDYLIEKILEKLELLIENTKAIKFKSHKVNKDVFNLYWNFFALENLVSNEFSQIERLAELLLNSANYRDYTIRERIAFLAKKLFHSGFQQISTVIEKLQHDENFYVRKALIQ
ncbi:MAG: hypothetical protein WCF95_02665 [bacterium]